MSVALPARRWTANGRFIDLVVVVAVLVVDLVGMALASAGRDVESPPFGVAGVVVAVANCVPLWWRRRRPLLVLAVLAVVAAVSAGVTEPGLLSQRTGVTLVLATYAVAAWSEHRRWAAAIPGLILVLLVVGGVDDGSSVVAAALAAVAAVGLPWTVGYAARSRRLYVEEVELRLAAAERDREGLARRAVVEERAHIARELHDVVAHHVSLIGVQAGAARATLPAGATGTRDALVAIEDASRSAVGEMRRLLDVMRPDGDAPDVAPPPGLGELGRLVGGFRAAGIDVATTCGVDGALDPVLSACCYRVVEEALTNVSRHSAARVANVDIGCTGDVVRIAVHDPGPALLPPPGGRRAGKGLIGMAERVALFGGSLRTGASPHGGFEVVAELPRGPHQ